MTATLSPWHPIETAPKDGRKILAWASIWPEFVIASWRENNVLGLGWEMHPNSEHFDLCEPTHWMPLPEPPK